MIKIKDIKYVKDSKCIDLTGQKFNYLTVLEFSHFTIYENYSSGKTKQRANWICECDCGNKTIVSSSSLKHGSVKSCGCYKINKAKDKRKYNIYELSKDGSYMIGYTGNKNDKFLFDVEDYDLIKHYYWSTTSTGYIQSTKRPSENNGIAMFFHRLVMGKTNIREDEVDHINRDKKDNRKENLRVCSHAQNMKNSSMQKNNKSGYLGVYWSKKDKSWYSQITLNRKHIHLGYTKTKEEAIIQRLKAELFYFGEEFAPQKVLMKEYGLL